MWHSKKIKEIHLFFKLRKFFWKNKWVSINQINKHEIEYDASDKITWLLQYECYTYIASENLALGTLSVLLTYFGNFLIWSKNIISVPIWKDLNSNKAFGNSTSTWHISLRHKIKPKDVLSLDEAVWMKYESSSTQSPPLAATLLQTQCFYSGKVRKCHWSLLKIL